MCRNLRMEFKGVEPECRSCSPPPRPKLNVLHFKAPWSNGGKASYSRCSGDHLQAWMCAHTCEHHILRQGIKG